MDGDWEDALYSWTFKILPSLLRLEPNGVLMLA